MLKELCENENSFVEGVGWDVINGVVFFKIIISVVRVLKKIKGNCYIVLWMYGK